MPEVFDSEDKQNLVNELSKSDRDKIVSMMVKDWRAVTDSPDWKELEEHSERAWDFYLNNQPRQSDINTPLKGQKQTVAGRKKGIRLGLIPRAVDSVHSIITNALFPVDERFYRGTPKNPISREFQELYEVHMQENMGLDNTVEEFKKFLLTTTLDRVACIGFPWKSKKKKRVYYEPKTLNLLGMKVPIPGTIERKVDNNYVEWEGTSPECLSLHDWRIDLSCSKPEDSWFQRRWYKPVWEVKKEYNLKKADPYKTVYDDYFAPEGEHYRNALNLPPPIDLEREEVDADNALLMIRYDDFVLSGKVYENHFAVIINGTDLIYFGPNQYDHGKVPYLVHSLIPIPKSIAGVSLINHALPSAVVFDRAISAFVNIAEWASKPVFEKDITEPALRNIIHIEAGMTIPTRRPNAVRQVPINTNNLTLLDAVMDRMESNIREVTGASPLFTGENPSEAPTNITAFHIDKHIQGANSRFQTMIGNFKNMVLEPFLYMAFENEKQFKTKTEVIYNGGQVSELSPEVIKQLDYTFYVTSADATNSRAKDLANYKAFVTEMLPAMVQAGIAVVSPNKKVVFHPEVGIKNMLVKAGLQDADQLMEVVELPPQVAPQQGDPNAGLIPDGGAQDPGLPPTA